MGRGTRRPMLEKGDFIPLFELTDTEHRVRGVEVYGGQHCLLFFLPADDPDYVSAFFRASAAADQARRNIRISGRCFILDDTVENLIALKEKTEDCRIRCGPIRTASWRRAFGLCKPEMKAVPPVGYVLNNNLKILRRHMILGQQLAAAVFGDCQAEIAPYEAKNRESRIISENAPALIIPDAFTPELCRKCIDAFHNGHRFEGTVGAEEKTGYRPNAKVRTDHIINGPLLHEIDEKFSRSVFPEIKKIFGFSVTHRELYKVGVYKGEKGGFFRAHRDNFDVPLGYRRVAMTVQLNDDYEGGGLRFPEYGDHIYRPAAGGAIAFSCSTIHEARPVTSGERYILVCFFHGEEEEAFRRQHLAGKGQPLRIKDYVAHLRPEADIVQSRDYFKEWQSQNVSFSKADAAHGKYQVAQFPVMVNTIGNHKPKKVFESSQGVVFDDFLPEDVYQKVRDFAVKAHYEYINTKGKVVSAWHVHDGFPLRSLNTMFYYADAAKKTAGRACLSDQNRFRSVCRICDGDPAAGAAHDRQGTGRVGVFLRDGMDLSARHRPVDA